MKQATPVAPVASSVPVDHVIFYAGYELDALAAFFERVGFSLTPLGRHNSGSVNRLAILDKQYLEIMGFEPGTPRHIRPELQGMSQGLNGIVGTELTGMPRRTSTEGLAPSVLLERPVSGSAGGSGVAHATGDRVASFTITHVSDCAADVRVFLCQHHTPELVWQSGWQGHKNGAMSIDEVRVATGDPVRVNAAIRKVFDIPEDEQRNVSRYDAGGTLVQVAAHGERARLTLTTRERAALLDILDSNCVAYTCSADSVLVPLPAQYGVELVFVEAKPQTQTV